MSLFPPARCDPSLPQQQGLAVYISATGHSDMSRLSTHSTTVSYSICRSTSHDPLSKGTPMGSFPCCHMNSRRCLPSCSESALPRERMLAAEAAASAFLSEPSSAGWSGSPGCLPPKVRRVAFDRARSHTGACAPNSKVPSRQTETTASRLPADPLPGAHRTSNLGRRAPRKMSTSRGLNFLARSSSISSGFARTRTVSSGRACDHWEQLVLGNPGVVRMCMRPLGWLVTGGWMGTHISGSGSRSVIGWQVRHGGDWC